MGWQVAVRPVAPHIFLVAPLHSHYDGSKLAAWCLLPRVIRLLRLTYAHPGSSSPGRAMCHTCSPTGEPEGMLRREVQAGAGDQPLPHSWTVLTMLHSNKSTQCIFH